jgi:hypothetical protein
MPFTSDLLRKSKPIGTLSRALLGDVNRQKARQKFIRFYDLIGFSIDLAVTGEIYSIRPWKIRDIADTDNEEIKSVNRFLFITRFIRFTSPWKAHAKAWAEWLRLAKQVG